MGIGLGYNRGTELHQPSSLFRHMYYMLKETQHNIQYTNTRLALQIYLFMNINVVANSNGFLSTVEDK